MKGQLQSVEEPWLGLDLQAAVLLAAPAKLHLT